MQPYLVFHFFIASTIFTFFCYFILVDLRSTFKKADVLNCPASQVYVLESSSVQSWIISFLLRPSATMSYFLVLRISCPSLNHLTSAFSLETSHSSSAVASSSTVWSSRGLVNSAGGSVQQMQLLFNNRIIISNANILRQTNDMYIFKQKFKYFYVCDSHLCFNKSTNHYHCNTRMVDIITSL